MVAEFLVAEALEAARQPRGEWDSYDVETSDGLRVEVTPSAHMQAGGPSLPRIGQDQRDGEPCRAAPGCCGR